MQAQSQQPLFSDEWERCKPWIEAALEHCHGTHTIDDVLEEIIKGEAQFWPGKKSAVVTEWHVYPRKTYLHFWLAGGNMIELLEAMLPCIETWAKDQGCENFSMFGRQGWSRAMRSKGYSPAQYICVKD